MKGVFILQRSPKKDKKFMVVTPSGKKIYFGATGYSDYTKHKDIERKERYVTRHRRNEKWGLDGVLTAGFWARWVLWNKPSLEASIKDTERRFGITIKTK